MSVFFVVTHTLPFFHQNSFPHVGDAFGLVMDVRDIESYPPISFVWRHIDSVVRPHWRSWQRWNSPRTIWSVTTTTRTLFLVRRRSSSDQIRTMVVAVVMPHRPFRVPYCKWSCGESFVLSRVDTRNMGAKSVCVCVSFASVGDSIRKTSEATTRACVYHCHVPIVAARASFRSARASTTAGGH